MIRLFIQTTISILERERKLRLGIKLTIIWCTLTLLFFGCASIQIPSVYKGVKSGAPIAMIVNYGVGNLSATTCRLPGLTSVCSASLLLVDGKRFLVSSATQAVEPGFHRLRLMCLFRKNTFPLFNTTETTILDIEITLASNTTYYVRGDMAYGKCWARLAENQDD